MAYTTVQKKAVHYTAGRDRPIRRIVLHWMATTLAGCDATFAGGQREASAHYGLEDTKRHQYVRESDTAWHAGDRTINHESIGIEHSAGPGRDATEATIANSIDLCTALCRRYGLTADAIDQHNDFYATQCPGTLPVSRIREAVRKNLTQPQEDDMPTAEEIAKAFWSYPSDVQGKTMWRRLVDAAKGVDNAPAATALAVMSYPSHVEGQTMWRAWVNDAAAANNPPQVTAEQIAAAIPSGLAAAVVDELNARLTPKES